MWKTQDRFWAQFGPFAHILTLKSADIHCTAASLALFSKPYFGQRNQVTLEKFDHLSEKLRRSRTGTLDFLITHYEWFEKHKKEVIG